MQALQINCCVHCMGDLEGATGDICPHCGNSARQAEQPAYCLRPFSILHGKYLVGKMLGQGGFGMTYIGLDLLLETKVAIKECYPENLASRNNEMSNDLHWNSALSKDKQWKTHCASFLREARKMAKMKNIPEVVRVQDTFEENNTAYIVMDYVDGITLKQYLVKNGVMSSFDCIKLLRPIMDALSSVHAEGFVHRDISPDNIMIKPDGSLKLLDLGAAKDFTKGRSGHSEMVIKDGFSPLEQYSESGSIGPWTDIYALCATIYYCITGKILPSALDRLDNQAVEFPADRLNGSISASVASALQDGLALEAKKRIQSMDELISRFENKKRRPQKPLMIAAATAAVVLIVSAVMLGILGGQGRDSKNNRDITTSSTPAVSLEPIIPKKEDSADKVNYLRPTTIKNGKAVSPLKEFDDKYTIKLIGFRNSLDTAPEEAIDVSLNGDGSVLAWVTGTHLIVAADGCISTTDASSLFYDFSDLEEIYFGGNFDTSEVTNMNAMFANCGKLKTVNLFGINTENVTDMSYMFDSCASLGEFDGSAFNTENVTDMSNMFSGCRGLRIINLSGFDTSKVTNMSCMFKNCGTVRKLNIKNFTLSEDTDVTDMFSGCNPVLLSSTIPAEFKQLLSEE